MSGRKSGQHIVTCICEWCKKSFNTYCSPLCPLCRKKKHYQNNRVKVALKTKQYRKDNRDSLLIKKKQWYNNNKEKSLLAHRNWALNNKEHIKQYKKNNKVRDLINKKKWLANNKEKEAAWKNEHSRKKYENDIKFRLKSVLRSRLYKAIKNKAKVGSAVKDLGCTVEFLIAYIESKFQTGMTWDNWKLDGWHIDHIKPLNSFDLTDKDQFLMANHYTNLQPLWAKENILKSDKIPQNLV